MLHRSAILYLLSFFPIALCDQNTPYTIVDNGIQLNGIGSFDITFDDRLKIFVSGLQSYYYALCIGPAESHASHQCPHGLSILQLPRNDAVTSQLFELDRNGILSVGSTSKPGPKLTSSVITVNVFEKLEGATVILQNAQIYVPPVTEEEEPEEETTTLQLQDETEKSKTLSAGVIAVIVCSCVFALVVIVIIAIVLGCHFWRKRSQKGKQKDLEKGKSKGKKTHAQASKEPPIPPQAIQDKTVEAPLPHTNETQTAPPSTDKKSAEPPSKPSTTKVSKPSAENPMSIETPGSKHDEKNEKSVATNVSIEQKPPTEQSLREDSTQRATDEEFSNPTPKFGETKAAKSLASNSKFLERPLDQVPRRFGKKFKKNKKVDEIDEYSAQLESQIDFAARNELITETDISRLRKRYKPCEHEVSQLEKLVLKGTPMTAVQAADELIEQAEIKLQDLGFIAASEMDQPKEVWDYINDKKTPATEVYWVLIHVLPTMVAINRQRLSDPLVESMPLPGLYMLIIDPRLKRQFREHLVFELRGRSATIIPHIQMDALRKTAFPGNYLALLYHKNPQRYVDGKSVKSKSRVDMQ